MRLAMDWNEVQRFLRWRMWELAFGVIALAEQDLHSFLVRL